VILKNQWPAQTEDVKRFVQANLSDIDAHYPDDFYNPAITRLYRLKEYMEENK
jgi:hypothetical protein